MPVKQGNLYLCKLGKLLRLLLIIIIEPCETNRKRSFNVSPTLWVMGDFGLDDDIREIDRQ